MASQSHHTDQGNSEASLCSWAPPVSASSRNPTIQIRAIPRRFTRSQREDSPKSRNPTIQIRAIPRVGISETKSASHSRSRNPTIQIRAIPRTDLETFLRMTDQKSQSHHTDQGNSEDGAKYCANADPGKYVAIPPYRSGQFRGGFIFALATGLMWGSVAIPPYRSGQFRELQRRQRLRPL